MLSVMEQDKNDFFKDLFCFLLLSRRGIHAHIIIDKVYSYQLIIINW